jgi:hypothetical protein
MDGAPLPTELLNEAELRDLYPVLAGLASNRWLAAELTKPAADRAPLAQWLERAPEGETNRFLDELAGNIATLDGTPGLAGRLDRLRGPLPEFWAAICEIKVAATMVSSHASVTFQLKTPDLWVVHSLGNVGVELTAKLPTIRFNTLRVAVTDAWDKDGRLILLCRDETIQFLTTQRDSLLALLRTVDYGYNAIAFLPTPFAYLNDGQVGGIDGDPGAVAVTWAARALFAGLAVLALAVADLGLIGRILRSNDQEAGPAVERH